jgi:hypothetical protein
MNQNGLPTYENKEIILTPIPGKFSRYRCDVMNGRVYDLEAQRYLTANPGKRFGYCKVRLLDDDGQQRIFGVHEVVMSSYMGVEVSWWRNQTPKLEVHHIDDSKVKINNGIRNLELTTREENIRKSIGKMKRDYKKLGSELAAKIKSDYEEFEGKRNHFINSWIERLNNEYSYSSIENLIKGVTYNKVIPNE